VLVLCLSLLLSCLLALSLPLLPSLRPLSPINSSLSICISSALAGAFSCSVTHSLILPLDALKTKLQAGKQQCTTNSAQAIKEILRNSGFDALFAGLGATATGYFMQGALKFGIYDYLKYQIAQHKSIQISEHSIRTLLICSGVAETVASTALCPWEAVKIQLMTCPQTMRPSSLNCLMQLLQTGGIRTLYRGLPWILLRQVPYTCVKLVGYDFVARQLASRITINTNSTGLLHPTLQCTSGVVAGLMAAFVSQPADVIMSRVYTQSSSATPISLRPITLRACFTGLKERGYMVAAMTALQFLIYENVRDSVMRSLSHY
jgi:solute carrier family 25 (mitochondrial phosphate transporter), member 3